MVTPTDLAPVVSQLRFLVADDHALMRSVVMQHLRAAGAGNIDTATDGQIAWDKVQQAASEGAPYHVLFLDWHMPTADGLSVLQNCRRDPRFKQTAVVMLTAEQEERSILHAIEAGATSYLIKPVSGENFTKNLHRVLDWLKKQSGLPAKGAETPEATAAMAAKKQQAILSEQLRAELAPVVSQSMKNIFSSMFDATIVSDQAIRSSAQNGLVTVGRLRQNDFVIALRFVFDRDLLMPLLRQLYSPELLQDEQTYRDAGCEIVNILGSQIKAFLNKRGYSLQLDFPETSAQDEKTAGAHSVMNVQFSLAGGDVFLVDVSAEAHA